MGDMSFTEYQIVVPFGNNMRLTLRIQNISSPELDYGVQQYFFFHADGPNELAK